MNAGQLLLITEDLVAMLQTQGILAADGTFDKAKLDTLQEDIAFAGAVEAVLKKHGLAVPERVDKLIQLLPLLVAVIR